MVSSFNRVRSRRRDVSQTGGGVRGKRDADCVRSGSLRGVNQSALTALAAGLTQRHLKQHPIMHQAPEPDRHGITGCSAIDACQLCGDIHVSGDSTEQLGLLNSLLYYTFYDKLSIYY